LKEATTSLTSYKSQLSEASTKIKQLEEELSAERKQRERAQTLAEALAGKVIYLYIISHTCFPGHMLHFMLQLINTNFSFVPSLVNKNLLWFRY
jgi:hypothetical protein